MSSLRLFCGDRRIVKEVSQGRSAVTEDEKGILDAITYNLKCESFGVVTCGRGDRGLKIIRDTSPLLDLLDFMLPGLDGFEVCRRLRSDPLTETIPIIIAPAEGEDPSPAPHLFLN